MSETDFDVKVELIEDDFDQIEQIENNDHDMTIDMSKKEKPTRKRPRKPAEKGVFPCEFCSYTASLKKCLSYHMATKHPSKPPDIPCPSCDKLFVSSQQLYQHTQNVHSSKIFECTHCIPPKMFGSRGFLQTHIRYVHDTVEGWVSLFIQSLKTGQFLTKSLT